MASVYLNRQARNWFWTDKAIGDDDTRKHQDTATATTASSLSVLAFHRLLPDYDETPLRDLPHIATRLGLGRVLLKDESCRFGLPSFKILGASWAVYRAVAARVGVSIADGDGASNTLASTQGGLLESLGARARERCIRLVTCTEGNWGRAVARMAKHLGVPARVYVPAFMPLATREKISGEGAEVLVVDGDYDDSVAAASRFAEENTAGGALLVMDIAWEGYEEIPQWVVEGYTTMLSEVDEQQTAVASLSNAAPRLSEGLGHITHVVVPVGCGSIAQAVTQNFKNATRHINVADASKPSSSSSVVVMAVEPTTAACLRASLEAGAMTTVATGDTIMAGLNCGTLSAAAWPVLRAGVDASIVVSDWQAHEAVRELGEMGGVSAGPCGAATLAALERACQGSRSEREYLGLDETAVVVLCCTEGAREYKAPYEANT